MMRYSVYLRHQIFIKCYGFLSFTKHMCRNISKSISKDLSGKYSQELIDDTKQSATVVLKTASKEAMQKTAEATGDLIGKRNFR